MKRHVVRVVAVLVVVSFPTFQATHTAARAQAPPAPAVAGAAIDIPGVVKGGTPIERILMGYDGLDQAISLTNRGGGSLVASVYTHDPRIASDLVFGIGTFHGDDMHAGRAVRVRFVWDARDAARPRWEQAFSADAGATWETNWVMVFTRLAAGEAGVNA